MFFGHVGLSWAESRVVSVVVVKECIYVMVECVLLYTALCFLGLTDKNSPQI